MAVTYNNYGTTKSDVATNAMTDHNVIPAYRFQLKVNGFFDVPLKSVRPIARKYEYEPIQEGGMNDYVHIKRKPISQPYELVVERYMQTEIDDKLAVGSKMTLPLILYIGRTNGQELSITQASRWYVFTGAQVMNVEFGGLDSERSGLLTEVVTIGYNMMFSISSSSDLNDAEIPFDLRENTGTVDQQLANGDFFQMRTITNKDRVGKYADKKGVLESSRTEMEAKRKLWSAKNDLKTASRQQYRIPEKDAKQREYGSLWAFALNNDKTAAIVEGNGKRRAQNAVSTKNSDGSETITGFGRVQKPKSEMEGLAKDHLFQFDANPKTVMGNGKVSSQNYRQTGTDDSGNPVFSGLGKASKSQPDMETAAKKWKFKGTDKVGEGDASRMNAKQALGASDEDWATAGVGYQEKSKAEMEALGEQHKFAFGVDYTKVKGNGVVSSKKDENSVIDKAKASLWRFDPKDAAAKTGPKNFEGIGSRHIQNATKTKSKGKEVIAGFGRIELRKAEMEKAKKLWALTDQFTKEGNKVRSAMNAKVETSAKRGAKVTTGVGSVEETKDKLEKKANQWKFDGTKKDGGGIRSRQNAKSSGTGKDETSGIGTVELSKDKMEDGAQLWEYSEAFMAEGGIARRPENELRKEDMEGNALVTENFPALPPNQPKARKWKFKGRDKAGKGTASANKNEKRTELSKDEMTGKARQHVFVKRPKGEAAEKRLWPDEESAVKGGNPDAKPPEIRQWPAQSSAQKNPKKGQQAAPRQWPGASSAKKPEKGQKPEVRQWPGKKSATQPQKGKAPDNRKWPDTASAQKNPNPGQQPRARLWPQVRSAQNIADFLMQ